MNELNKNDTALLGFCGNEEKTTRQVAEHLNIAPKNVLVRLEKLEKQDLIKVERKGQGKKTFIRTKSGIKTKDYYLTLLKEIKKRGGVTKEEFFSILPFDPSDLKERDRMNAQMTLQFVTPKLIQQKFFITKEGEEFLKKHSKNK